MLNGWLLGYEEKKMKSIITSSCNISGWCVLAVCWRVEWSVEAKVGERNVLYCGRFSGCLIHAFGKLSTFSRCFCFMTNLDNAGWLCGEWPRLLLSSRRTKQGIQDDEFPFTKVTKLMSVRKSVSCVVCGETGLSIACVGESLCVPVWLIRSTKARE